MPKGPWGEGFKECIAWVKRNRKKVTNPRAYCGAIYQAQQGKRKKKYVYEDGVIPTPLLIKSVEDNSELWYNFAAPRIGDGLQVQLGFRDIYHINYNKTKGAKIWLDWIDCPNPHTGELTLDFDEAEVHAGKSGDTFYLFDILWATKGGEPVDIPYNYIDKFKLLASALTQTDHWRMVESYPVSSKASFDDAIKRLSDTDPFIRANKGSDYVQAIHPEPTELGFCYHANDGDVCPIRKGADYPIECVYADYYRCGFLKSIYYGDTT